MDCLYLQISRPGSEPMKLRRAWRALPEAQLLCRYCRSCRRECPPHTSIPPGKTIGTPQASCPKENNEGMPCSCPCLKKQTCRAASAGVHFFVLKALIRHRAPFLKGSGIAQIGNNKAPAIARSCISSLAFNSACAISASSTMEVCTCLRKSKDVRGPRNTSTP